MKKWFRVQQSGGEALIFGMDLRNGKSINKKIYQQFSGNVSHSTNVGTNRRHRGNPNGATIHTDARPSSGEEIIEESNYSLLG